MTASRIRSAGVGLVLIIATSALAAPIPSGLSVSGTISLDTTNSLGPVGSATQSGTLSHLSGGATTTTSFTDSPSSISPSSLTGALTQTGDGIGATFSMSATSTGAIAQTDGLFTDFTLSLNNTSATDTFVVTFLATAINSVEANGANAFAYSDISVLDALNVEVFFSDYRADTLNPGSNLASASAGNTFAVTLNPGASYTFTALQRQRGGTFAAGNYSASLEAFLALDSVTVRNGGGGNTVPLPGTLLLTGIGLLALRIARRRASA